MPTEDPADKNRPGESADYESIQLDLTSTARPAGRPRTPVALSSDIHLGPIASSLATLTIDEWRAAADAPGSDPDLARLLDRGEIARGGMGSIRAVFDKSILRQVALKRLDPEFAEKSPDAAQLLIEEAQITGQLEHPNIVPVYDLGAGADGTPMFTMKLLEGETLGQLIASADPRRRSEADLRHLLDALIRVCDAVSFAHSRGVIHRDLKPDNVMIGSHGQVYLMDWGCALLPHMVRQGTTAIGSAPREPRSSGFPVPPVVTLGHQQTLRIAPDALLGTAAYMAPEQAKGQVDKIDERTDVWGLGGILYEILTQQPPRVASSSVEAIMMAQRMPIVSPEKACPQTPMPRGLVDIAMTALSFEQDRRYPSVAALKDTIEAFLRGPWWCAITTFAPGAEIVSEGEPGDAAYIIERGHCEAYRNEGEGRRLLRRMGPGEVFGETAIIMSKPRSATVVAVDEVTLHVVTRSALEDELGMDSWIGAFVRALANRFREAEDRAEQRGALVDERHAVHAMVVHVELAGGSAPWAALALAIADRFGLPVARVTELAEAAAELAVDREGDVIRRT